MSAPSFTDALAVARDLLGELGDEDGRRLIEALLVGHHVVGPFVLVNEESGTRLGLGAGRVAGTHLIQGEWHWQLDVGAFEGLGLGFPKDWPGGRANTAQEADAAMCKVLRGLGWLCLGAS